MDSFFAYFGVLIQIFTNQPMRIDKYKRLLIF